MQRLSLLLGFLCMISFSAFSAELIDCPETPDKHFAYLKSSEDKCVEISLDLAEISPIMKSDIDLNKDESKPSIPLVFDVPHSKNQTIMDIADILEAIKNSPNNLPNVKSSIEKVKNNPTRLKQLLFPSDYLGIEIAFSTTADLFAKKTFLTMFPYTFNKR